VLDLEESYFLCKRQAITVIGHFTEGTYKEIVKNERNTVLKKKKRKRRRKEERKKKQKRKEMK
jgi:cytochrome b subunit of formate dehydrogenase